MLIDYVKIFLAISKTIRFLLLENTFLNNANLLEFTGAYIKIHTISTQFSFWNLQQI